MAALTLLTVPSGVLASPLSITMNLATAEGLGEVVGTITLEDTGYGLLLTPALENLKSGSHGFHIHENPSCEPAEKDGQMVAALAAGGHYDPLGTGVHDGPYGEGHLGDLPPLYIDENGSANLPVLAPRLNLANVLGRSLMIHVGGDNFSDTPQALGGGGARFACGVIPATLSAS